MTVPAPDVVDPRREAVAAYLLEEIEIYCSTRDSAMRRAGEIIAAVDAASAAEIARLREEVAELRAETDETNHQAGIMDDMIAALRARVAELEAAFREVRAVDARTTNPLGVVHGICDRALGDDHG